MRHPVYNTIRSSISNESIHVLSPFFNRIKHLLLCLSLNNIVTPLPTRQLRLQRGNPDLDVYNTPFKLKIAMYMICLGDYLSLRSYNVYRVVQQRLIGFRSAHFMARNDQNVLRGCTRRPPLDSLMPSPSKPQLAITWSNWVMIHCRVD